MDFVKQYVILHKKAKTDLKAAKILLDGFNKGDDELDLEVVMFHLQQCAEKLLKSILAFNKQHFTKTHSIETLVESLRSCDYSIKINIEALIPLSDYAVEGRYAIFHDDLEDMDAYMTILEEFVYFVDYEISRGN